MQSHLRATLLLTVLLHACFPMVSRAAESHWFKGNLHTHSLWSDGDDYPEMIADWYKKHGYQFLMLSDHNTLQEGDRWIDVEKSKGRKLAFDKYVKRFGADWVERRETKGRLEARLKTLTEFRGKFDEANKFLMIQGEEITSQHLTAPVHVNATNLRKVIKPASGDSVVAVLRANVNAVLEQRKETGVPMFPHLNHPNFRWGVTAEELMQVEGERFFEVYNGHPQVNYEGDATHAGCERIWDIVLTRRLAELKLPSLFGLATDDSHAYHTNSVKLSNPGRGWVMVRTTELTPENIVKAMEAGEFYASSGVTLKDFSFDGKSLRIEIQGEKNVRYTTEFIGTRKGYDPANEPVKGPNGAPLRVTHRYSDDIGAVLDTRIGTSVSYELKGDEIYVRARITSSKPKKNPYAVGEFERAWVQPVMPLEK